MVLSLTITLIIAVVATAVATSDSKPRARLISIGTAAVYPPKPDRPTCRGSNRAIGFYRQAVRETLGRIGPVELPARRWWGCNSARRRAVEWRAKAHEARRQVAEYLDRMYDWASWLPDKYARVGACETGYGQRPGNWEHDSGTYVSAFGIIRGAYDDFSRRLGYPGWDEGGRTPRQQYEVAAAIQAAYGWGAWGCGGA
jgi:hypothetical protein